MLAGETRSASAPVLLGELTRFGLCNPPSTVVLVAGDEWVIGSRLAAQPRTECLGVHAEPTREAERAIMRYQHAFETGKLGPDRFADRIAALDTRLDALRDQDDRLAHDLARHAPTTIRPSWPPSPRTSTTSSPTATPSKPKRCCGC